MAAILAFEPRRDASNDDATAARADFEALGFDLGRDHARFGLTPPAEHMMVGHPLREGWQLGRAAFGSRTRAATPSVRQWLALRLSAWLQGRHVDTLTVTPNYLAQLRVSHCPITREALDGEDGANPPRVVRLCDDAGFAAGHLAQLSPRAAAALDGLDFEALLDKLRELQAQPRAAQTGWRRGSVSMSLPQWSRLAVLRSFVTALPHAQAAALPLLVLPPNRLRLRNPVQGLQALLTLQLAKSGWSKRMPTLEALMPHAAARRELRQFFMTLMPKVIAGGRPDDAQAWRWAMEDAWRHPQVQAQWKRFALLLDAEQCNAILARAVDAGLTPQRAQMHSDAQATDGWSLETQGFAPLPGAARQTGRKDARPVGTARQAALPTVTLRQMSLPI